MKNNLPTEFNIIDGLSYVHAYFASIVISALYRYLFYRVPGFLSQ